MNVLLVNCKSSITHVKKSPISSHWCPMNSLKSWFIDDNLFLLSRECIWCIWRSCQIDYISIYIVNELNAIWSYFKNWLWCNRFRECLWSCQVVLRFCLKHSLLVILPRLANHYSTIGLCLPFGCKITKGSLEWIWTQIFQKHSHVAWVCEAFQIIH